MEKKYLIRNIHTGYYLYADSLGNEAWTSNSKLAETWDSITYLELAISKLSKGTYEIRTLYFVK